MADPMLLLTALFLPLFPLSMVFNALLQRAGHPVARALLLLAWPQAGLWLLAGQTAEVPSWFVTWALATALLYGFRLLAMREIGRWVGFVATSAWALLWLPAYGGVEAAGLWGSAAAFSVPLVFIVLLAAVLEARFGAAYTGIYGGLALAMPRFAGVLVVSVLAVTATPLFPSFFAMLQALVVSQPVPAVTLTVVWLIWSWAAARLLQGLIVGTPARATGQDLGVATTWAYALGFIVLVVAGLALTGSHL